jgi:hypothetical protein
LSGSSSAAVTTSLDVDLSPQISIKTIAGGVSAGEWPLASFISTSSSCLCYWLLAL